MAEFLKPLQIKLKQPVTPLEPAAKVELALCNNVAKRNAQNKRSFGRQVASLVMRFLHFNKPTAVKTYSGLPRFDNSSFARLYSRIL